MPVFAVQNGRNGRLSIQTDPRLYRHTAAMVVGDALQMHLL